MHLKSVLSSSRASWYELAIVDLEHTGSGPAGIILIGCLTSKISRVNEDILHIGNLFSVVINILIGIELTKIAQIDWLFKFF